MMIYVKTFLFTCFSLSVIFCTEGGGGGGWLEGGLAVYCVLVSRKTD